MEQTDQFIVEDLYEKLEEVKESQKPEISVMEE